MFAKDRVGYVAMTDNLYRAVVILELLGSDDIGVVAVYMAVYTDYIPYDTRYCAYVVRHHEYCHLGR